MNDRDSLTELFAIISDYAEKRHLTYTASAMPYIKERFNIGCNVYYRRRLSVCRMLIDMHLPVSNDQLDILLAVALSHSLPGDNVPEDHMAIMKSLYAHDDQVTSVLATLRHPNYSDESYYTELLQNKHALIIRLTERGVLMEKLFEYPIPAARRYIRETRENFFPMCVYAKEHYREYLGAVTLLMEKMRNLIAANEVLLIRYEAIENNLGNELLSIKEENAAMRAMILELQNSY